MENKIRSVHSLISKKKLTTLNDEILLDTLYLIKISYLKEWCDILDIDRNRRPFNI